MAKAPRQLGDIIGTLPDWKPHEKPMLPGSASTPDFPPHKRALFAFVAILLALTSGLGTALISVNMQNIQGELGLDTRQGAWLSAIYVAFNISMNLLLIKYRQQFGLSSFAKVFLAIYAMAALGHLVTNTYLGAIGLRAISGISGAAVSSLAIFYMMQALPAKFRIQTLLLGVGASQVAMPLAWIISPYLLDVGSWQSLYALEAGMALASLVATSLLSLPPGIRVQAFEWKDAVSFALLAPGFGLVVIVAALGRIDWWLDAPWLGWALAGAVLLLTAGILFEHHRENPLIDTRWFLTFGFANFAFSIFLTRMLLSEQPFGLIGSMQLLGFGAEHLRTLYTIIFFATLAGVLASAFSLLISNKLIAVQLLLAPILIALGAFLDAGATVDSHPSTHYFSQALIAFSGIFFLTGAMLMGLSQLLSRGFQSIITFAVTFSMTQVLGGLIGSAFLSTFQIYRTQHHLAYLSEQLAASDPQAAMALQMFGAAYAPSIADPALRSAQGASTLAQQTMQQANILAFNDVFLLIGWGAIIALVLNIIVLVEQAIRSKNNPKPAGAAGALAL